MFHTQEQQQLALLSVLHPENIFNSDSSLHTLSDIVQKSCFDSLLGDDSNALVTIAATSPTSSFLNSAAGSFSDKSVQCPLSYELNSGGLTVPFSACSSVKPPKLVAPKISLETIVNSKRQNLQLRDQNKIKNLNFLLDNDASPSSFLRYLSLPLVRGFITGGSRIRPPKKPLIPGTKFLAAKLKLENSSLEDMCLPEWNEDELEDRRRIIRIERRQQGNEIVASFSIVGSAVENPQTKPALDPDVEVLEISCLQCLEDCNEINGKQSVHERVFHEVEPDFTKPRRHKFTGRPIGCDYISSEASLGSRYYVTSVEVIKIIETLVGSYLIQDPQQRRKERGCVRSNLAPFWSKHVVTSSTKNMKRRLKPGFDDKYIAELADRIKTYEVRRPRKVDKDLRILEWSKLGQALQRALQSYYAVVLPAKPRTKVVLETRDEMHKTYQY